MTNSGWYFPNYTNAVKLHYSADGTVSLCRKYGTLGTDKFFASDEVGVDKLCKTCSKVLEKTKI